MLLAAGCDPQEAADAEPEAVDAPTGKADGATEPEVDPAEVEPVEVDPAEVDWEDVGYGVTYQEIPGSIGDDVLIVYGGYTAKLAYSQSWAQELYRAHLRGLGVRHVYAVQGPAQAGYGAREIGNSKLARHLVAYADQVDTIHVVAHSSGAFVAHELLRQLTVGGLDPEGMTSGLIAYYNLDGGGSGFASTQAEHLGRLVYVYARSGGSVSANRSSMTWQADAYEGAELVEIDASSSGCYSGAKWCLHDAIIISRPHNRSTFDLRRDYQDFDDERRVVTRYFDP